jgi:sulfatase modifying factor 1
MKCNASLLCVVWSLALAVSSCGGESTGPQSGSESHFLGSCARTADCAAGLECRCGLCTRPCAAPTECASLGRPATCLDNVALSSSCSATGGICVPSCTTSAECGALTCRAGTCQFFAAQAPDAGSIQFVPATARSCIQPDGGVGLLCNGESCCTSITVPGGTFPQGRGTESCGLVGCQPGTGNEGCPNFNVAGMYCSSDEAPEFSSTVSGFALDKYEVTVGRFRKFVDAYVDNTVSAPAAGAGANPNIPDSGWQSFWNGELPATRATFNDTWHLHCASGYETWTDTAGANENRAINCVDRYEAFAFCIWDGGRPPTEAEWEYAAAGGSDNRLYPWGSATPDCTYANFYNGYWCSGVSGSVVEVGSTPIGNGKWGHADLAGNVYEWTLDWYYRYPTTANTNYANIVLGPNISGYVLRGGAFGSVATILRAASRYSSYDFYYDVGLRCARTVQ